MPIKAAPDKFELRRRSLTEYIADLMANGFHALPVNFEHALALRTLPALHRDPFDRMLVAQAQCEDLTIVTADSAIEAHDVQTMDATE
jgi:PIN domain nuclease of toxin-antitoxin system